MTDITSAIESNSATTATSDGTVSAAASQVFTELKQAASSAFGTHWDTVDDFLLGTLRALANKSVLAPTAVALHDADVAAGKEACECAGYTLDELNAQLQQSLQSVSQAIVANCGIDEATVQAALKTTLAAVPAPTAPNIPNLSAIAP